MNTLNDYEISEDTLAIIPMKNNMSKIIEKNNVLIVNLSPMDIINYSCLYFGSSYEGRHSATKHLLGISYKSPIVIEESRNMIFFPTKSPRLFNCYWISLKNISNYNEYKNNSEIVFKNGFKLEIPISYGSLDNQILRATRLESILRNKK